MIFIFLSCREKAHDNKEFSPENSKPRVIAQWQHIKKKETWVGNKKPTLT